MNIEDLPDGLIEAVIKKLKADKVKKPEKIVIDPDIPNSNAPQQLGISS